MTVAGRTVELIFPEDELLRLLSQNVRRVVPRARLLLALWGRRDAEDRGPVRTFVKKLRRKLGDDVARPTYILTERGVGCRMPAGSA